MKRSTLFSLALACTLATRLAADPNAHAGDDEFWIRAANLLPNHTTTAAPPVSTRSGKWGSVLSWPHVPVSIAVLPNGKLLTYSGQEPKYWPGTAHRTHWALWNPSSGTFANDIHQGHEMFCAHPVMRTDGNLQTMGGRYTIEHSSVYDWKTNRWARVANMNGKRWYTTAVALPDGDVVTFGGSGSPNTVERYDRDADRWNLLGGISWQPVSSAAGFEADGWPFLMVAPDGRLFHFGPTDAMHWVDASGNGSRVSAGVTVPGNHYPHDGGIVMIDSGKYLIAGGAASASSSTAGKFCYTVDLNTTPPTVASTGQLNYARSHVNIVALPSGEVVAIGGNTTGQRFSDNGSILPAEVWNPATGTWRVLASMAIPRNYHSTAALLPDGRIFSGGGGFDSGNPNSSYTHSDAQIFTPPALLDSNNNAVGRPAISSTPESVTVGSVFNVTATPGTRRFTFIRMMAVTHGVSSDQRVLSLPFAETSSGNYQLITHPNHNVMVPGYWMLFATNANGVYSEAKIIQVKELANPASLANEALVSGNDRHELFIDGKLVSIGTNWQEAVRTAFAANPDTTIAIRAVNAGGSAGVIGEFDIAGRQVSTDGAWKVSTSAPAGWEQPGFNDSSWAFATTLEADKPVNWPATSGARWIWSANAASDSQVFLRFKSGGPALASIADKLNLVGETVSFLSATDAVAGSTLAFTAVGLPAGLSINASTGRISGTMTTEGLFQPTITVTDQSNRRATRTFYWVVRLTNYQPTGTLLREVWNNFTGTTISALTSDSRFPGSPSTSGEINSFPVGVNSGSNYGSRLRGYFHPPVTGSYTFWLSTDDHGELRLGTSDNPASATTIAFIDGWADSPTQWTKFASQKSAPLNLVAGQRYYLEILQREGGGADHINLAWQAPGITGPVVIDMNTLSRWRDNNPPVMAVIANRAQTVGTSATFAASSTDPDGDSLAYTASGLPAGIILNSSSGAISGLPSTPGTYDVTVTVRDTGGLTDSKSFVWTINPELVLPESVTSPSESGAAATFTINSTGGTAVTYRWNFGDGSTEVTTSSPSASHTYATPGRYSVTLTATDASGTSRTIRFIKLIHPALTTGLPANSQSIITTGTPGNSRLWNVNPDQNTVSVFDAQMRVKLAEIPVGKTPRCVAASPSGIIWVVNKEAATLSLVNPTTNLVASTISLPRGSRPHGLVFSPAGGSAWLALEATGQVLQLNPTTAAIVKTIPVGGSPRHLAINHDGSRLFVSRFITPLVSGENTATPDLSGSGGLIEEINTTTGVIVREIVLHPSIEPDSGGGARGLPNYLGAPALSPANDFAWIPSKQDNIQRGVLRDGLQLDHDKTMRAISSRVSLATGLEVADSRVDHDNASMPSAAIFDSSGLHVFVALEGARQVAVIDAYGRQELFRFPVERAPQGLALSPDGQTLFVHNFMSRSVTVHDISSLVRNGILTAPLSATLDATDDEALSPEVLLGKQHFYDAFDDRISREDYISCASCHSEEGHDGRVWDFTGFGEGLRNTIDLRGRGGPEHGPFHWSANFDEIQDFEGQLRSLAGGTGLIAGGTPHPPLGTPNGGRSADLDALAAFLGSLTTPPDSPFRTTDGSLSAEARAGANLFISKGCVECHSGPAFTDSGTSFHNIGTITAASGQRLGSELPGLDTPSLMTVFDGAPYLHDGSAATIEEAIEAHFDIATTATQRANLAAYLRQLDGTSGAPLNRAPVLSAVADQTSLVGDTISLALSATDPEGQAPGYYASGLPDGLTLDSTTGRITGILVAEGAFTVTVSASDGSLSDSKSFNWTVTAPAPISLAFGGVPVPITSRIEAENYDTGGPGVSYLDTTPENYGANFGQNYRNEGVDLEWSYDVGGTSSIGWVEPGEWTRYSVELVPGTYDLVVRAASEFTNPGSARILLDGVLLGEVDIDGTGSWYGWDDFILPGIEITGTGPAVLQLVFTGEAFNANWIEFRTPGGGGEGPVQTPFNGVAATIPGRIEAENFDEGGQTVAYRDSEDENYGATYTGLNYRADGVDIEPSYDQDASPSIGWTDGGEWLEYTVEVTPGTYDLKARVASGFALPGGMTVELDGVVIGTFDAPGTGDWYNWETITLPAITITSGGTKVLRLLMTGDAAFNLNWVEFGDNTTPPPPPTAQAPYGGVARAIPGLIQAEDYDLGGEGVAYHDAEAINYGGNYRADGVDIEPSGDTDGGFSVGWFDHAQWMEYTVDVSPGIYEMALRVSSAETVVGDVKVTLDGADLGTFAVESTGAWTNWQTLTLPAISLPDAGKKILRLEMVGDAVNVNWISFVEQAAASNLAFAMVAQTGTLPSSTVDSDGDGLANLAEFAFGSDAGIPDSRPVLPVGYDQEGNCCQTVPVAVGGTLVGNTYRAAGLVYRFQGSLDLAAWNQSVTFLPNPADLPAAPAGYKFLTFRLADTTSGTGFLRVLVEEQP